MKKRITFKIVLLSMATTFVGCGGGSSMRGQEDSVPALDALLDKDPSAMSEELMFSGGWQGRLTLGDNEYRVYEVTLDGKRVHLFYLPTETVGGGLRLHMYDVEPFQIGQ